MENLRDRLRARKGSEQTRNENVASVERSSPGTHASATVAQKGLWVADASAGNVAFTVPILLRIEGPLNARLLDTALLLLVDRHTALRTIFREDEGGLTQVLEAVPEKILRNISLHDSRDDLREEQSQKIVDAEISKGFALTREIPFRATLISLSPESHKLLLTIHHIACDQWSMGIFARELNEAYSALVDGKTPILDPIDVDYLHLGGEETDSQKSIDYFVERAKGLPALRLAPDKRRPPRNSHSGDEIYMWLGEERNTQIRECAKELKASPFIITLAALLVLAQGQSGESEFVFGTSSAGRSSQRLTGVVGFFVNILAVAASVSTSDTFEQMVSKLKSSLGEALENSSAPFDEVVKQVGASGDGTGNALVAVVIQQDNTPRSAFSFAGCQTTLEDNVNSHSSKYELLISVRNQADDTRIHVQYDSDLFTSKRIASLLESLDNILEITCRNPNTIISNLPLISPKEEGLIAEVNNTKKYFGGLLTLHEYVLAKAESEPKEPAIFLPSGEAVTYGQIAEESRLAASSLAAAGVGDNDTVLVSLPPSREYVVSCLAVMLTGAAFIPVASDTPKNRLERIVSTSRLAFEIREYEDLERLVCNGLPFQAPAIDPESRAYVIFTSGSTGVPKGVQVLHRGIVNNLKDLSDRLCLTKDDRCLAISSTSFDMSIFEFFGILGSGGSVVILDNDYRLDPSHWIERAVEDQATIWNSAPALLGLFLDALQEEVGLGLPPLRAAVLGGDWVPISMPGQWRSMFPESTFDVLGGATEASIHSTFTRVSQVDSSWISIPYGTPMANQKVKVVDENNRACPIGVPGRLLIGGLGLSGGYLAPAEERTTPFTINIDDESWYDTGDIARWTTSLNLELLGRSDFLIKKNGLRIEPGDVETALLKTGQCTAARVMLQERSTNLIAVLEADRPPNVDAINNQLSGILPSYMIPAEFHWLNSLPLNANGKIDRRKTESMIGASTTLGSLTEEVPLSTRQELHIASVWSTVLGVEITNANADFFNMGGDSFKAITTARLVNPTLPTVALFKYPTVRELAAFLDSHENPGVKKCLVNLSESGGGPKPRLVCVPYGGGNAISYQNLAEELGQDYEVIAVNLPGHDLADDSGLQPIDQVVEQVVAELSELPETITAIYSQCAGSAVADRLARAMRSAGQRLDMVFIGAALPDEDPQASMALVNDANDDMLLGHMTGLGGFNGLLDDSDVDRILGIVRHDLREMVNMYLQYEQSLPQPLAVPVCCVIGDEDPATRGYKTKYKNWARLGHPVSLVILSGADHYFSENDAERLAAKIREKITPLFSQNTIQEEK